MTIIYNAEDHFHVICKLQGSVWPKVLPFCIFNIILTIGVYYLHIYTCIDLTFNGGVGYRYISVLVSFFTISNLSSTYGRFWEARGHLGTALYECNMLAARTALYTAHDPSDKADVWRATLKNNLIKLIDTALYMIQDDRASLLFNLMNFETNSLDFERHGLKNTDNLTSSVSSIIKEKNVMACAMKVDATIITADKHVVDGCKNEGELLTRSAGIVAAYFNLIKFSTTPRPFVIAQMGRTLVFLWVLSLPGAVLNDHKTELFESIFLVFLVTYGFLGLTLVEIELHDPLGNDENDLETARYLKLIKCDIESLLGKDSLSSQGKLLTSAYHVSHGGYGGI
mmetsp:Transcript_12697/g.23403  ORF Transcript_12697/g.23403 Transcript_12697/m.23403 type:complete len:340 (-) Transcript_12697:129-1148(-)|eukprot:CAMPEP_0201873756 /NCGR_PEP_ID=MMETSP0902-20130614/6174_1 /ASSEMBLY_ACC=CAM_ASM_000551 /TAXON_ID=420261 /ORGANISM="Thalassiosira antarctica, Strain CCMP982" /LENGTH=339 /DNA_ID=CAMNT_0048400431 /DNA_START=39 /DNA_END=1058 /DNA_ORIENTATION=+